MAVRRDGADFLTATGIVVAVRGFLRVLHDNGDLHLPRPRPRLDLDSVVPVPAVREAPNVTAAASVMIFFMKKIASSTFDNQQASIRQIAGPGKGCLSSEFQLPAIRAFGIPIEQGMP
ncbi:hypothetical protein [Streptomyces sp. NPDC004579]|uniref:hypothetical protein n=1 Tax=Streptomyces sp. NPDC004579 TaxID=3154667 RepID=UPI0033B3671B